MEQDRLYRFDFSELSAEACHDRSDAGGRGIIVAGNVDEMLAATSISLGNLNALCSSLYRDDVEFKSRREAVDWLFAFAEANLLTPDDEPASEVLVSEEAAPSTQGPPEQAHTSPQPISYVRNRILHGRILKHNPLGPAAKSGSKMANALEFIKASAEGVSFETYRGAGFGEQEARNAFQTGSIQVIDSGTGTAIDPRDWRQWLTPRARTTDISEKPAAAPPGRKSVFAGKLLRIAPGLPGNPRRQHSKGHAGMDYLISHPEGVTYEDFVDLGFRRIDVASGYRKGFIDIVDQKEDATSS